MSILRSMTNLEREELIEVTSIVADVQLGVRERWYAYRSQGPATAMAEITICAERQDPCSRVDFVVRYRVSAGDAWRPARKSRERFDEMALATAEADSVKRILMSWLRNVTPVPPRRGAGQSGDCSCH